MGGLRSILLGGGAIVTVMGTLWALQGAYLIPATFMRGYDWIYIGAAVAALGLAMILIALRMGPRKPEPVAASAPLVEEKRRVRADEVRGDVRSPEAE